MELFDSEEMRRSVVEAMNKELQPYERAIAQMMKDFSGVQLDEKLIIGIHRSCSLCKEILQKQFSGKKEY
jgi:hypothetical protein